MPHPIPDIPGVQADPQIRDHLQGHLANLCQLRGRNRFPGAQPVSFTKDSLALLENMDFWVCEKSDGVRVLIFIVMNTALGRQETWLVDRNEHFFGVEGLHFPHWENSDTPLIDTVLDGELVIDIDPATGEHKLRYYAFDCLVHNGVNIMDRNIEKRFGRLKMWVVEPFEKGLKRTPQWRDELPFEIVLKKQDKGHNVESVVRDHIPSLEHGHDGLIFTCAQTGYVAGTDEKILKWKPPSENSIDFQLHLRFPPSPRDPSQPDYTSKPAFLLYQWLGSSSSSSGAEYEFFDYLEMSDPEWEEIKQSGEQYDERVVEVCWDKEREDGAGSWRIMRFRDDKPHGNHKSIVGKILTSIKDGVELDVLLEHSKAVREGFYNRHPEQRQQPPQRNDRNERSDKNGNANGNGNGNEKNDRPPIPSRPSHSQSHLQSQAQGVRPGSAHGLAPAPVMGSSGPPPGLKR